MHIIDIVVQSYVSRICSIYIQKKGQEISWKWIESLYLKETSTMTPGVRLCFKLTRDHVWLNSFTRMRVYLAAQV